MSVSLLKLIYRISIGRQSKSGSGHIEIWVKDEEA